MNVLQLERLWTKTTEPQFIDDILAIYNVRFNNKSHEALALAECLVEYFKNKSNIE